MRWKRGAASNGKDARGRCVALDTGKSALRSSRTSSLFTLRSGEGIMQEMYVFEDKGGRSMALRPEITAAVIRMYINEAKVAPKPLRWCYFADCFRYERPQKGRYRQFWQFGAELIGADTAIADAEVIMLAADALNATGRHMGPQGGPSRIHEKSLKGSRTSRLSAG